MNQPTRMSILAALAAAGLAGCAAPPSQTDLAFGAAVRAASAAQIIDPDAARNPAAPSGMEGNAAKSTIDRYEKSFEAPPAPVNVFAIGMGAAGAGAK